VELTGVDAGSSGEPTSSSIGIMIVAPTAELAL
jgi:hypothetical protein